MAEVLKKFGRYFLLDHLAQGGMAEIYRARLAATDGAGRLLVIKRIQAGYGANDEFLQMFKSETKVMMGFSHPNIVQLYDFGDEQNQPYIAMELVDGKNLRQFGTRFNELKQTFPVELAVYIIEQASSGLHYAHSFRDKITGDHMSIVHRDISPQNILISYEGNVKIIDFGIAKASTNSENTRAGVIKGKPSYLSPEQISGEILDGRCDIFALGIVLWELLCGKKLFAGENDLAVLKLIESANSHVKPPSTINPKVPKELDYIVLKALAKQRDKRYQTAEELQRALHKFLYGFMPEFNPSDLAYYAKDLFKNEIVDDRKKIQKLNEKVESLLLAAAAPEPKTMNLILDPTKPSGEKETTTIVSPRGGSSTGAREFTADEVSKTPKVELVPQPAAASRPRQAQPISASAARAMGSSASTQRGTGAQRPAPPRQQKSGGGFRTAFLSVAALLAVAFLGPNFGVRVPVLSDLLVDLTSGGSPKLVLDGNQKDVIVTVNGQTVAHSLPATITAITPGSPFQLVVSGQDGTFQQSFTLSKGEKRTVPVILTQPERTIASPNQPIFGGTDSGMGAAMGGKTIQLRLNITPGGGAPLISIKGKPVDPNNPSVNVPLDSPLELVVERQGFKPFKREFVLESRQMSGLKEWLMDVPLDPLHFGFLTIHTTPSADATIQLDGKPWVKKTPLENEKLPTGTYDIRLNNEVLGMEKRISVTIQEGKSISLDERLEIRN